MNKLLSIYSFLRTYEFKPKQITYGRTNLSISKKDLVKCIGIRGVVFVLFSPFLAVFLFISLATDFITFLAEVIDAIVNIYIRDFIFSPIDDLKLKIGRKLEEKIL